MTGEEVARELVSVLQVHYDVGTESLLAAMHDRASVNQAAMAIVRVMYPLLMDIGCFSHTVNNAGNRFTTPVLNEFLTSWIRLFSHSPKACLLWKDHTGMPIKSYSKTRWWSKWEVAKQLMELFGDIVPFLEASEDVGLATRKKMKEILDNARNKTVLMLELAITIDAGRPFVELTYNLEGDGPLAFTCYEEVEKLCGAIRISHFPNLTRIADDLSGGQASVAQQYLQYGRSCVQPGFDYIQDKFNSALKPAVMFFKAARLFNPHRVRDLNPDSTALDSMSAFPFLNSTDISNLKVELPQYLARAEDITSSLCPLVWWSRNAPDLPNWAGVCRKVLLVQPSSACAERVFSILNESFSDRQDSSLQDYVETSLMLQFNK